MSDVYVSIDVEADGPIPGVYSMLQLGAVAYNKYGEELDNYSVNLRRLPYADQDPHTMAFWAKHQGVYDSFAVGAVEPERAMRAFTKWAKELKGDRLTLVGYPVAYDFMFVHWYLYRFCGGSPFSHSAMDIKTMAAVLMDKPYREATKSNMPKRWFNGSPPHTHNALDDARGQGVLFFNIKRELEQLHINYVEALHELQRR